MIDLNADVGEGYDDENLLPLVTSVNIACGAHAGDDETMERTIERALALGLTIGAHPGYADREHFGRRPQHLAPGEVEDLVAEQVARLSEIAGRYGARLSHVKPHGALYNQAADDEELMRAIARGAARIHDGLRLVRLAGTGTGDTVEGLPVFAEAFADRRYTADGRLAPRTSVGGVITEAAEAAAQALAIARNEPVATVDGGSIRLRADTICLHGDSAFAVDNARAVRDALERAGVELAPL